VPAMDLGPDLDARRARVAADGFTGDAVAGLTPVVRALPLDALTPAKQALKRFFSTESWTAADDDALADVVGPGSGIDHVELAPDLVVVWGWTDDRFRLRVLDAVPTGPADG
jgi:hypothetical protein